MTEQTPTAEIDAPPVLCPTCGAKPGKPCRGLSLRLPTLHAARARAATTRPIPPGSGDAS